MKFRIGTVATQYSVERAKQLEKTGMEFIYKTFVYPNQATERFAVQEKDGEMEFISLGQLYDFIKEFASPDGVIIHLADGDGRKENIIRIYDDYAE